MKIEIWSDFVCPFCYIGKRNLDTALEDFPHRDQVDIEIKSYQLDPNTPPYTGQDFYEGMATKFGTVEQSKQMMSGITEQAKSVGLDFHFDTMKATNTFDAHRLTKFAQIHGKDNTISEKLLQAVLTDSKDIGDLDTLVGIAENVGLNKEEALATLQDKQAYANEVHADIAEAKQLDITGVPYFIINRKYALSGAQPKEAFTEALNKVVEEEGSIKKFESLSTNKDSAACSDDGCEVPDQKE